MSDFKCDKCGKEYVIATLELWEVYESDGKDTEFDCTGCDAELIITTSVTGWTFDAEVNED